MPLQKQVLPVALGQGVDTKTDQKQVVSGKLLALNNGRFSTTKEIKKRPGTAAYPQNVVPTGSINKGLGLEAYQNELTLVDGANLYSYSPSENAWSNRGSLVTTSLSTTSVARSSRPLIHQGAAYDSTTNLICYVWSNNLLGSFYSIVDKATGATIVTQQSLGAAAFAPKVFYFNNSFVIFYSSTTFNYVRIQTSTPTVLGSPVVVATDLGVTYDCTAFNSRLYIAYDVSGSAAIKLRYLDATFALSPATSISGHNANIGISILGDSSTNNAWVFFSELVTGSYHQYYFILDNLLTTNILATTQFDSVTGATNIAAVITSTGHASVYYDSVQTATGSGQVIDTIIQTNTLTQSGTVGTAASFLRGVMPASKVFIDNGQFYFFVIYSGALVLSLANNFVAAQQSLESTYFLINIQTAAIIAKVAPGNAGGYPSTSSIADVAQIGSWQFLFPFLIKDNLASQNGAVFYETGVSAAFINLQPNTAPPKAVLGENLLIGGGQVQMYDGANVVEHGFHLYPENLVGSAGPVAGAIGTGNVTTAINQIQYCAVYEWADCEGQIHRSAPSIPLSIPLLAGYPRVTALGNFNQGSTSVTSVVILVGTFMVGQRISNGNVAPGTYIKAINGATWTLSQPAISSTPSSGFDGNLYTTDCNCFSVYVPTLRMTSKANVQIVLYRTACNGTVFYRASSLTTPTYNDKTIDFVRFDDTVPDTTLIGNEELYTTGEIENIAAPAANVLFTNSKGRMILVPSESPNAWWFSKQVVSGSPVEFSDFFITNVSTKLGNITAVGEMDDKLVLFSANGLGYVTGTGPSANGENNDFSSLVLVPGAVGCTNQASVINTPDGLMYQSQNGIYLLSRNMQNPYLGADVEAYNGYQVTSSIQTPGTTEIEFTLNNGQRLIYDYYSRQWGVDALAQEALDSTIFQNVSTYLSPTGLVTQTNPAGYTDNGAFIPLSLKTSWLQLSGIQGFQRVWQLNILGEYKSPHTLLVNIYTDFSSTIQQTVSIPVLSDPGGYQFSIHIVPQKCEAIQIEIMDQQSSSYGEGFSISALTFEAGIKQGMRTIAEAKSYG